jgi:tRNA(Ile)-lysidine synthase
MTSRVTQKVAGFCQKQALIVKKDKVVIGVSGGPDSLCLLHLLVNLKPELELTITVAHLNHQLRNSDAQADENFVREIAARWQLPLWVETHNVAALATRRKQSLEEAGRQIRYAFLWRVAAEIGAEKIAVGHNADDQVETVLMHFLRGSGLAGLRGMLPAVNITALRLNPADIPAPAPTPSPKLIRPLLEISRKEIEAYCREQNLSPRQDYSNQDITFFRNRLRHELIPQLETYNPNIRQVLQHTAGVVAADTEILNNHLDKAWQSVVKNESPEKIELELQNWLNLPLAMKRSTLRRAVQKLRRSLRDINFEHIETAVNIVEKGRTGTKATLPQGLMLTVGYNTFTITPEGISPYPQKLDIPHLAQDEVLPLNLPGVTSLPRTNWQLKAALLPKNNLNQQHISRVDPWEVYLDADEVGDAPVLRTRRPGDRFCPLGLGGHSKKVNEFMINEKIPANRRHSLPLLVADNRILWICGHRPDERARIRPTTRRVLHLKFQQQ